jgi:hypothetical protein
MPEHLNSALDRQTIQRMATEGLLLVLTPAEVEALHPLLNSLLEEIRQVSTRDRAGAEPEPTVLVQGWPS